MNKPLLSLIICTYRRPGPVGDLLAALRTQTHLPDETLIVDASPDEATEAVVAVATATWPEAGLRYLRAPADQRGLTRQRNYGIRHAAGSIIAFLDDDTIPDPAYFAELLAGFAAHPEAAGMGGWISNEVAWWRVAPGSRGGLGVFRWNDWARREDYRWRVRRALGLGSPLPPGHLPPHGHGRPVGFFPPDGQRYRVEFLFGGASAWRRAVLTQHGFSPYFEGYGLYEDLDFSVRVSRRQPLYLCTQARLAHYHAPSGRPNMFGYGVMVVRNGWYVWRQRWPQPPPGAGARWWAISLLLTGCRLVDSLRGPARLAALTEAAGRVWGMVQLAIRKPRPVAPAPVLEGS